MDDQNQVVNLDQFRNRKSAEKKRTTERIFFHNLVGVYGLESPEKMVRVELIDVSDQGLGIQVPYKSERTWPAQDTAVPLRLYFSPENFMEIVVDIKNSRPTIDGGVRYHRFGCEVRQDHRSYPAWQKFVDFLKAFTEISEGDEGDIGYGNL